MIERSVPAGRRSVSHSMWIGALVGLILGVLLSVAYFWFSKPPAYKLFNRKLRIVLTDELPKGLWARNSAISPSGRMLVFVQNNRLWIRDLNELEALEIPNTLGATSPFWSPDGDFIGFFDLEARKLKKLAIDGERISNVCELQASFYGNGTWGYDGTIVFSINPGLFSIQHEGGNPKLLEERNEEKDPVAPFFLRDGHLLCSIWKQNGGSDLVLISEKSRKTILEIPNGRIIHLAFSEDHLLYQIEWSPRKGIWAAPFDRINLEITGQPFLVDQNGVGPSTAADGTLLYQSDPAEALRQLVWVKRNGDFLGRTGTPQIGLGEPALSPDGSKVAVSALENENWDIWIHDVKRETKDRLTTHLSFDFEPTWSPLGDMIAFASGRAETTVSNIFIKRISGLGEPQQLHLLGINGVPCWSKDGKYLVYFVDGPGHTFDIGYSLMNESPETILFLDTPSYENEAVLSPDSMYLAYVSDESGRYEVYVRPFPSGDDVWTISVNGGVHPKWNGRGDELFYMEGDALMAVKVDREPGFSPYSPRKLFDTNRVGIRLYNTLDPIDPTYDVTPDGQRFIMIESLGASSLIFIENWHTEFRNRK